MLHTNALSSFHHINRVQVTHPKGNILFCSNPANMARNRHKRNACVLAISFDQPNKHPIIAFISSALSGRATIVSHT